MKLSNFNLIVPLGEKRILFNTLSGHCVEIEEEVANLISSNKIDLLSPQLVRDFVNLGIIVEEAYNETSVIKYYHDKEKYSSNMLLSTVLLTWGCNLKCVYCFEGSDHNFHNMNFTEANKYIKFLKKQAIENRYGHISICLFGGEPLLNFDMAKYILDEVRDFCEKNDLTYSCFVITNGTLLSDEVLEVLLYHHCNMIQVTLDGIKETHDSRRMYKNAQGSFDDIIANLKMLNARKNDVHSVIRVNIDKTNLAETYALLKYIGKNGMNLTNCTVDFGIVRGSTESCAAYSGHCLVEEEIGEVLYDLWSAAEAEGFKYNIRPMRKWLYCGLYSDNQFTVTPDCEVYKCWEHAGQKEHLMGTIDEDGNLVNIQNTFYEWMSHDPLAIKECRNCVYLPVCGGGCGVISYNKEKNYHAPGCFKVKGVVEKQLLKYFEDVLR
ncbi:MAG: Cys-every-fifth radical SAM/SPASM peptide maturase CefB [Lachnospiraceae bacterium]|nr:Cys-every-fifth radical SAM/SPASM peptide maturase CefB [Lachnospiraceae bacterium]